MPSCFDPFCDRLSRDIRNELSRSLLLCLRENNLTEAEKVAERYLAGPVDPCHRIYIRDRLANYERFLALAQGASDPLRLGFLLWDLGLHFEVHEIMEQAWRRSQGTEKELFQALIRAAGVRIKRECGYGEAAAKMVNRALPVLLAHRKRLARYTDPDRFFSELTEIP